MAIKKGHEKMTTIDMNIEAVQEIQRRLLEISYQIENRLRPLQNNVHNLPPQWQGTSADQFFEQFGEVEGSISSVMETLNEIASRLSEDIAYWESVADKLG